MSSTETPVLATNDNPEIETIKVTSSQSDKCQTITCMIFWWVISGMAFFCMLFKDPLFSLLLLIFIVGGFIPGFTINGVTEVTIDKTNNILIFQKQRFYNYCCKSKPKIVDLSEIDKIRFVMSIIAFGNAVSSKEFKIIYKNGKIEDISTYFDYCTDKSLLNCQHFLKKNLSIEDSISQIMEVNTDEVNVNNSNIDHKINEDDIKKSIPTTSENMELQVY